jgi:hypothetical protein
MQRAKHRHKPPPAAGCKRETEKRSTDGGVSYDR